MNGFGGVSSSGYYLDDKYEFYTDDPEVQVSSADTRFDIDPINEAINEKR